MILNQDGTINAIGSMPNYPLEVPEFIASDKQYFLWQWNLVGDVTLQESWIKNALPVDNKELVLKRRAFGNDLLNDFLSENIAMNISFQDNVILLTKLMNAKQMLEVGALDTASILIASIETDSIFTPERQANYVQRIATYLNEEG